MSLLLGKYDSLHNIVHKYLSIKCHQMSNFRVSLFANTERLKLSKLLDTVLVRVARDLCTYMSVDRKKLLLCSQGIWNGIDPRHTIPFFNNNDQGCAS